MAGKHLMKTGALAALAVGLAVAAVPSVASAQDDQGRHGRWQQGGGGGDGGRGGNRGGGWGQQQAAQQPQAVPQQQVQQAPRVDRGDTPGRGWGDRREGQHFGRDWSNGGAVNRPDAAWRNRAAEQAQQAPQQQQRTYADAWRESARQQQMQREQAQRDGQQRTYADAWRNRSYTPQQYDGRQQYDRRQYDGRQGWNGDRRWDGNRQWNGDRTGVWNRDWRRDSRFGWQTYRNQHRDVFRMGRYYSPYNNWSYRRLGIGFMLQPLFFSQDYWIDDPWMYRLPEAYGPYRWVRYYDDALLVDIYSGEVVDVIYDFFW